MARSGVIYLLFLGIMILSGCDKDEWEGLESLSGTLFEITSDAQEVRVPVRSSSAWEVTGKAGKWYQFRQVKGEKVDTLVVDVTVNIARQGRGVDLQLASDDETLGIEVRQAAATGDYFFELPIVFHVLYDSPGNNVPAEKLTSCLDKVNALYANTSGKGVDMGFRFVLATRDPDGKLLDEPGIHRVRRAGLPMSGKKFMDNVFGDVTMMWNQREYINVVVFPFTGEDGRFGAAYTPFMPQGVPVPGLVQTNWYATHLPTDFVYCMIWNSSRIDETYTIVGEGVVVETGGYITLAHELGHYLGLLHPFTNSKGETGDYCDDTPDYDLDEYESYLALLGGTATSPVEYYREAVKRVALDGTRFVSENFMDYDIGYMWSSTPDQQARVRTVLENAWMIPGPKIDLSGARSADTVKPPKPEPVS